MMLPGKAVELNVTENFRNKLTTNPELKSIFDAQVKSIVWKTKLAKDTIQVPRGKEVEEIQIFWLEVNTRTFDEQIVRFFDRKIGYHLIFILENKGRIQIWASDKTAKETAESYFTVKKYYHTGWFVPEMLFLFEEGKNLDEIYLSLFQQIQKIESDARDLFRASKIAPHFQEMIDIAKKNIPLSPREIKSIYENKPLSKEQKEKIFNSYLRIVISLAIKFCGRCKGQNDYVEECISEACRGLMKAIDSYDIKKNGYFSSYAQRHIWETLEQGREDRAGEIRLPTHIHECLTKIRLAEAKFFRENGREPTIDEYAKILHLSPDKIRKFLWVRENPISIATPIGEDEDCTLEDFIKDTESILPEDSLEKSLLKQSMKEVLETLSERETKIIRARFGIDTGYPKTLAEVGKMFNITRARVQQIEKKAIRKLRHPSRTRAFKDFS